MRCGAAVRGVGLGGVRTPTSRANPNPPLPPIPRWDYLNLAAFLQQLQRVTAVQEAGQAGAQAGAQLAAAAGRRIVAKAKW